MDDHAPGIKSISRPRSQRACQGNHQCNLHRTRESLPPDKNLSILDALLWVVYAVLRKKFNEGDTRAHVEEGPGKIEELCHAPPDPQGLRRRKDVCRQDQVLVNNKRNKKYKPDTQGYQEPAKRAMKAHLFTLCP